MIKYKIGQYVRPKQGGAAMEINSVFVEADNSVAYGLLFVDGEGDAHLCSMKEDDLVPAGEEDTT